jgi:ribulose-5-phosphate 4-epimerase/fuculose-1-phosphate aldolase
MADLTALIRDLVAANRVLAHENVCDAYGHISVRHPDNPNRYLLSRSRSPELVEPEDILEFNLDNTPVKPTDTPIYIERPIHGAIYESRPDVMSVVHNHCHEILPFAISNAPMRPAIHGARRLGQSIPMWDIRTRFGDTDLLVTTLEQGRDLARTLGRQKAVVMRGHGCAVSGRDIADAVASCLSLQANAQAIAQAVAMGAEITWLTPGEIDAPQAGGANLRGHDRQWEYLCRRAGVKL